MKRVSTAQPSCAPLSSLFWALLLLLLIGCDSAVTSDADLGGSHARAHLGMHVAGDNVALVWGEACLESIRESRHGPPMTGRTLAMVHTAMYDAWAAYDAVALGTRYGGLLRRPASERTLANKEAAISYAAFRTLVDLFPGREGVFRSLMISLGYDPDDVGTNPATSAGIGNMAAGALLAFRHGDGANQAGGYADYSGYAPVNGPLDPSQPGLSELNHPSRWQPLIHNGDAQRWTVAHWRYVEPFALESNDQFMPPPPVAVTSGAFHRQVQEVINLQAKLTDRQKVIAEYWADGPSSEFPPGHWCTIAQYVSQRDRHTLDDDIKLLFLVSNAMLDASIGAWTAKIEYDYVRPVSAVRYLKYGKRIRGWAGPGEGTRVLMGEAWTPYQPADFVTPPFAEYVSGHSTFSMAAATVLRLFAGSDDYGACNTFPPGWSRVEPGRAPAHEVELCWETFSAAAEEAGMSRLYGGIHFRQGNEEGLVMGRKIGHAVWTKAQQYFQGSAASPHASM